LVQESELALGQEPVLVAEQEPVLVSEQEPVQELALVRELVQELALVRELVSAPMWTAARLGWTRRRHRTPLGWRWQAHQRQGACYGGLFACAVDLEALEPPWQGA
jgi:hypothetical protein